MLHTAASTSEHTLIKGSKSLCCVLSLCSKKGPFLLHPLLSVHRTMDGNNLTRVTNLQLYRNLTIL